MSMRLSFCVKAATTLDADDLDTLTTGIEGYVKTGVDERQAEKMALDDLIAEVARDRAAVMQLVREQHPGLFIGSQNAENAAADPVAESQAPGRAADGEGVVANTTGGSSTAPPAAAQSAAPEAAQSAAPAAEAGKGKKPGDVENFGEALPPSRRQRLASLDATLSDDEIEAKPLSEIWPLSENEAIEDTFAAAVAHTARDSIPTKPRKGYKLDRWVDSVKVVRQLAQFITSGKFTREQFIAKVPKTYALEGFMSKVALLDAIGRQHWKRIGEVREHPGAYTFEGGQKVPTPQVSVTIDGKHHWLRGSGAIADHIAAVNELLGDAAPEKRMEFEVRGSGNSFSINKKGDSEYRPLKTFATAAEASAYKRANYADLVKAWEAVKDRDNVTEADTRSDENKDRIGPDYRKGRDITSDEFDTTFGFKGGEFGKWVSQGKGAQERQWMLNRAYDALMDLAGIVGVPPRALSLNGTLGMAFGSRGTGKFSAHFEPSNLVINLTKTRGAGALAHEWFHALDNYFARARGGEVAFTGDQAAYRRDNYVTYKPEPMMIGKGPGMRGPMRKAELERRRKLQPDSKYYAAENWQVDPKHPEGVRPEVEERFADLVKALDEAPMTKRAAMIDKGADGYWSRIIERAARSFEAYVKFRLMSEGRSSDYLANITPLDAFVRDKGRYPYPTPDEIKPVADAFAALFDTIQTRTDEAGNVAMFSRAASDAVRAGDVFKTPTGEAATVTRTLPGGRVEVRIQGKRTRIGEWQTAGLKEWPKIGRATYEDGVYTTPADLIAAAADDATFSRTQDTPRGLSLDEAEAIVGAVREANPTAPPMIVLESVDQAPSALRRDIEDAGAANDVEAAYHEGKVYVFAPHLKSMERAMFVIAHHELRHHGMRSLAGRRLSTVLAGMVMSNPKLRDAAKAKMSDGLAKDMIQGAEEALADMDVAEIQALKGWPKLVAAVRDWLRGFAQRLRAKGHTTLADAIDPKEWTDADVAAFVARAEAVSKGGRAKFGTDGTVFQRVWHGTPYRGIDKFSTDAIGSGEGAQAYGWGLYFAGRKEVADYYRQALAYKAFEVMPEAKKRGIDLSAGAAGAVVRQTSANPTATNEQIARRVQYESASARSIDLAKLADFVGEYRKAGGGQLYEVDIPEDSEMLLWDRPLSEQPAKVRKALEGLRTATTFDEVMRGKSVAELLEWVDTFDRNNSFAEWIENDAPNTTADELRQILRENYSDSDLGAYLASDKFEPSRTGESMYRELTSKLAGGPAVNAMTREQLNDWYEREVGYRPDDDNGSPLPLQELRDLVAGFNDEVVQAGDAPRTVSLYLAALGVRGIKYLDGTSRPTTVDDKRAMALLEKNKNDVDAALDEFMRSVFNTPKAKEGVRAAMRATMERLKDAAYNYVIFSGDDAQIKATMFSRAPRITQDTHDGAPVFASDDITIAFPQDAERFEVIPGPGERVVNYAIMPAQGFDVLGHVELLIRDGKPVSLLDIEITPTGRRQGAGRKTIETLLAANPDSDLNISNIVQDARGFWSKMGVPQQNLEQGAAYDGTLNWNTYAQAKDDAAANRAAAQGRAARGERNARAEGPGRSAAQEAQQGLTAFSRAAPRTAHDMVWEVVKSANTPAKARAAFLGATENINRFNLWDKTIGTQLNMARKNPYFARVFEAFQQQQDDTAAFAIEAEAEAVDVMARMGSGKEIVSSLKATVTGERSADLAAVSKAIFSNIEGERGVQQKVFTDEELTRDFGLNERQISQYRQARAAIDQSLDRYAQSLVVRAAQKFVGTEDVRRAGLDETVEAVLERLKFQRGSIEEARDADPINGAREFGNLTPAEQIELTHASATKLLDKKIEALDAAIEQIPDIQKTANDLKDAGYSPAMRFGNYSVTATARDGTVEFFTMVDSKLQANVLRMQLRKELPNATVTAAAVDQESFKIFGGVSPDTVELFAKFMEVDQTDAFKEFVALAASSRSALKRMLERKGVAGFSQNLPQVLAAFITSNSRAAARNLNGEEIAAAMESVQKNARGDVSEQAAKLHQYMANPSDDGAKIRGFMFAYYLGGSVASALVNITQPVMMTAPYLHQFAGNKVAGIMGRAAKTAATGETTNAALKSAMIRAAKEGVTDTHEYYQMMQEAGGSGNVPVRAAMKAWGAMFGAAERFNRKITFAAAFEVAQGMTAAQLKANGAVDAYTFAKRAVDETQGVYARHNRPNWARGTAGALLMTFKQYSVAYIEFFSRLPTKQKLLALAMLILMAGLEGLPFAEDLEDLIDTIGQKMGYDTNSKRTLRLAATNLFGEAGAEFALHGISGLSGMPMDVAGRLGMGNLIPGTRLFNPSATDKGREVLEIAGPAGGLAKKALEAFDQADPSRAYPTAFANAAKAIVMFDTGQYRDGKNKRVQDVDGMDAAMKLIGFQPQSVAAGSRKITEQIRDVDTAKRVESEIVNEWAEGIRSKDPEAVAAARERLKQWNEDNPNLPIRIRLSQVFAKVKAANLTRDARFMKTAPPELRARLLAEAQ